MTRWCRWSRARWSRGCDRATIPDTSRGRRADFRATFHVPRQIGAPRQHFRRRRPRRPFLLRRYLLDARPGEAWAADADAVAQRLAAALNQEQKLVRRVDHDRAGAFPAAIINQLPFESRIERPLLGLARIFRPTQPLLRFELREQRTLRLIGWLLLIAGLLLIALTLRLSVAEQELDETAAHIGAPGISGRRRQRPLRGLLGVNHGGFRKWCGFDRCGLMKSGTKTRCSGEERKMHSLEHQRTLHCFVMAGARSAPLHATS